MMHARRACDDDGPRLQTNPENVSFSWFRFGSNSDLPRGSVFGTFFEFFFAPPLVSAMMLIKCSRMGFSD